VCVSNCDLEISTVRRPRPDVGCCAREEEKEEEKEKAEEKEKEEKL